MNGSHGLLSISPFFFSLMLQSKVLFRSSVCIVPSTLHMTSFNHSTLTGSQNIRDKVSKLCPVGKTTHFSIMAFSSALRLLLREYVGTRKLQNESGWVLLPSRYSPQSTHFLICQPWRTLELMASFQESIFQSPQSTSGDLGDKYLGGDSREVTCWL